MLTFILILKFTISFGLVLNPNGPKHREYSTGCVTQVIEDQFVKSNKLLTILTTANLSVNGYGIQNAVIKEVSSRLRWMVEVVGGERREIHTTHFCVNCPLQEGEKPIIRYNFQLLYRTSYCVTIVDTYAQLKEAFGHLRRSEIFNFRMYFVVYVATVTHDHATMAEEMLKFLWRHNVFNTAVIIPRDSLQVCGIYGLDVYADSKICGQSPKLVQMDTCVQGTVTKKWKLFGNKLPEKYNNCSIPTVAMKYPPFVINETDGFEIKVLRELGKILHINFDIKMIEDAVDWGVRLDFNNWTGPLEAVYKKSAIAIGNIIPHPDYDADFDLSIEYFRERMVWVVPVALPIERWKNIFVIFPFTTWLLCFAFYVVTSILLHLTSKWTEEHSPYKDLSVTFLISLEILLSMGVHRQPKTYATRSVFISIAVYSILVLVMYQVLLMGHLLNPVYEDQISTLGDIVESKIGIGGIKRYRDFFNDSSDKVSQYIYDIFEIYDESNDTALNWLLTVANDRDTCTISNQFYVRYMVEKNHSLFVNQWGDENIVMLKELIFTYPVRMIMPRGFPLRAAFDRVIWKLLNGGLIREWAERYREHTHSNSEETDEDDDDTVLTIYHLQGAFILLFYGYAISLCAFLVEILIRRISERKSCR